jgi:hypothetical protein
VLEHQLVVMRVVENEQPPVALADALLQRRDALGRVSLGDGRGR